MVYLQFKASDAGPFQTVKAELRLDNDGHNVVFWNGRTYKLRGYSEPRGPWIRVKGRRVEVTIPVGLL